MPVEVRIDLSGATPQEQSAFMARNGTALQQLTSSAVTVRFVAEPGTTKPSVADVYGEMMQSVRYYGGIRYILLPVYVAAFASLAAQWFDAEGTVPPMLLALAGFTLSMGLLIIEWGLSENLRLIWKEVARLVEHTLPEKINPLPQRNRRINLALTRGLFYAVYLSGLAFWGDLLLGLLRAPG